MCDTDGEDGPSVTRERQFLSSDVPAASVGHLIGGMGGVQICAQVPPF